MIITTMSSRLLLGVDEKVIHSSVSGPPICMNLTILNACQIMS
jgi:hypothetical protein